MRIPLQVRYNDYDERGHVNNAVYLTYFELARMAAWEAAGKGREPEFILADAHVRYRSPAMLGEALAVEVSLGELRTKAWVWNYRVVSTSDGRLVADGETTQVMYDYATRRTIPIPDELRTALQKG